MSDSGVPGGEQAASEKGLLTLVRDSGAEFGMAIGRGTDGDPGSDEIVDVQIAATGEAAASLVAAVEAWHEWWLTGSESGG
jgi:hypothetical protein